jgi:outer membrane protein assembly factor BamB
VVSGATVYAGGLFTSIGGQTRNRIAALDAATGSATSWDPNADNDVYALAASGTTVYAGGDFTNIGGQTRNNIAALDAGTGSATSWDSNANGQVQVLGVSGTTVYAGGDFTSVGGQTRNRIAALDAGTGSATSWDPNANYGLYALAVSGPTVYTGGNFTSIGGQARNFIAALDTATGSATPWDPNAVNDDVIAIAPSGTRVYAGGFFSTIGGQSRPNFAVFCRAGATPSSVAATAVGNNRIDLTWTGSASSRVYRSRTSGGPYTLVGTSGTGSFSDAAVEGGVTYYYVVKDFTSGCDGDASAEVSAAAPGACTSAPVDFEGVAGATQDVGSTCAVRVVWAAGTSLCGGGLTYAVYRDTSPTFSPDPTNRLATWLSGTSFTDSASLAAATTYYYVVRATSGINGKEDSNTIRLPVTPAACTISAPEPVEFFDVRSGDGENTLEWANPVGGYQATILRYRTDTFPTDALDGFPVGAGVFAGTPGTKDTTTHTGLTNGTTYYYGAFVEDASGALSSPATSFGRPDVMTGSGKWGYTTGATALATAGVIPNQSYFVVSNDRVLHGLLPDATGGTWPGPWTPFAMNGPSQNRPTVVQLSATTVGGTTRVVLVGSQDGRVYALNADTGAFIWASPVLGAAVQAAPAATFTDFGGVADLVLVGTREPTGDSKFYGLNLGTGTPAWTFTNGGGASGIGIISAQAQVSYPNRLFFTSRRKGGGSADTVWCLEFTGSSVAKVWSASMGDSDAAPVLRAGVLYVGNNAGEVQALDPGTGAPLWSAPYPTGDGPVKGYVWRDSASPRLYFSTTTKVHAITDDGGSASTFWTTPVVLANASPPFVRSGRVYVGGGASRVYSIDGTTTTPGAPTSVVLGDPAVPKVAGSPTFDSRTGLLVLGTDLGVIYAVALPF